MSLIEGLVISIADRCDRPTKAKLSAPGTATPSAGPRQLQVPRPKSGEAARPPIDGAHKVGDARTL